MVQELHTGMHAELSHAKGLAQLTAYFFDHLCSLYYMLQATTIPS